MPKQKTSSPGGARVAGPGKRIGRPLISGAPLRRRPIGMTEDQWRWLERESLRIGRSVDSVLREMVEGKMLDG